MSSETNKKYLLNLFESFDAILSLDNNKMQLGFHILLSRNICEKRDIIENSLNNI